jgi:hypothetical protein
MPPTTADVSDVYDEHIDGDDATMLNRLGLSQSLPPQHGVGMTSGRGAENARHTLPTLTLTGRLTVHVFRTTLQFTHTRRRRM